MRIQILSTSLFCIALACSTIPASAGMRVEISKPLGQARVWESRGDLRFAMDRIKIAEAVPNQTDEEKNAVAHVKALVMHDYSRSTNLGAFDAAGPAFDSQDRAASVVYDQPHQIPLPGGTEVVTSVSASN